MGLRPEGQHGNRPHSRGKEGRWNDSNAAVVLKPVVVPNAVVGLKKRLSSSNLLLMRSYPGLQLLPLCRATFEETFICHALISFDFIPQVAVIASY